MLRVVLIAGGGAMGALLRYLVSGLVQRFADGSFPLGTLFVNLLGCLLIGFVGALFAGPHLIREEYRTALLVGVLGAFTTFSSFGWETFALVNTSQVWLAVVNILLNNSLGLGAVWLGYRSGTICFGA